MKKLILFIALLGGWSHAYALTAAQIISEARIYLKDQSTVATRQQFSDATLLAFANDGQRELVGSSWLLQTTASLSLTSGTTEYALPASFLATIRVLINGVDVYQTTQNRLDSEIPSWRSSTGTPTLYYLYLTTSPTIGFYPAPNASLTATVYYAYSVTDMASTAETPFNGYSIMAPYQTGLIDYVTCRSYLTLEELELANPYCQKWTSYMTSARAGLSAKPYFSVAPRTQ